MKFEYPVALSGAEDNAPKFLKGASNRTGYFPVGRLNTWHGGVHFEGDKAIRAIADGKIIAFRVPKTYLTETVNGRTAKYSNGFVLIQHEYESPKGQQLTFYSFYNHLLALEEMKGVKIPDIFKGERYKVKATANDSLKVDGVRIRARAVTGSILAVAAKGTILSGVKAVGDAGWLSVTYTTPQKKVIYGFTKGGTGENDKWVDVATGKVLVSMANGENGDKGAFLRSKAETGNNIVCLMPPNSPVEIAPESQGKSGWLKVVNYGPDKLEGWCFDTGLEKEAIVILDEKMCGGVKEVCMEVGAGTVVGFAGYNGFENQTAYRAAHVEVFSSDDAVKDFLKNAKKDGENEQKFVKFPKGTEFKTAIPKTVRKNSKIKLLADRTDQYQLVEVENIALTVSNRDATLGEYESKGNYYEFLADHSDKVSAFNEEAGSIAKIGDKVRLMEDANHVSQKSTREVEHINPAKGLVFWAKKEWIEKMVITLPAIAEPAAVAVEAEVGEGIDPVFANLPAARDLGVVTQPTVEVEPVTVDYDVLNLDLSEVHLLNPEAKTTNNKLEIDVVIDLKKGSEYKDDNGKVWRLLDFSEYRADGTLAAYKGLVKEDDLKDRFSAYDWAKFGFRILEDVNNDYIFDFKERSDFFKEICKLVDEDKNGILEPHELQSALNNPYTADKLSKLVCKHHNEWAYGGKRLSGLMSAVEKVFQKGIDLEQDEERKKSLEELKKERMEAFEAKVKHMSIWDDIAPKEKGFWSSWFEGLLATNPTTAPGYWTFKGARWVYDRAMEHFSEEVPLKPFPANQPVVYHFHPIAFVEQMKRISDCFCHRDLSVSEVEDIIAALRKSEPSMYKGENKDKLFYSSNCNLPEKEKSYQRFTEELNRVFKNYEINTCIRKIHFLAQVYHETDRFRTTKEYATTATYAPYFGRGLMQLTWESNYKLYKAFSNIDCIANKELIAEDLKLAFDSAGWYWKQGKVLSVGGNWSAPVSAPNYVKVVNPSYPKQTVKYLDNGVMKSYGTVNFNLIADDDYVDVISWLVNGGANGLVERRKYCEELKKIFEYENKCVSK